MDNTLPQELDKKKRQKVYESYCAIFSILEVITFVISIALGIKVYTYYYEFVYQSELKTLSRILDFIFAGMSIVACVIIFIRNIREEKKDIEAYKIDGSGGLLNPMWLRSYSYPTFVVTLMNLVYSSLYRYLLLPLPSTFIYCLYVILFLFTILSVQWIKPIDKLFREQNIFKTILLLITPILIAFCIDYFLVV
ncbi:MAG TPA: hypothetical protein PLR16_01955 [Bacilli bacterium]|nr:MAG: hypothetical protein BWY97_00575 [Tenericutes bacterium ADurb.BinA124]HNZ50116.1 hypothetical protein [Bacilli bacterium]HPX84030.1 hypothetical protein [Bacilli bacterium]